MILGFHAGKKHSVFLQDNLRIYKEINCNAIELGLINAYDPARWETIFNLNPEDLKAFEFVSVHAPALGFVYRDSEETHQVLQKLDSLYKKINFVHAVIHPDRVEDWNIFEKYSFPVAVENMDNRKTSFRSVADMRKLFEILDVSMVLDLNHCFANDPTMKLAADFLNFFSDRITEIHLSGYASDNPHEALHKTKQANMFQPFISQNIPVILEGEMNDAEDLRQEYKYVTALH